MNKTEQKKLLEDYQQKYTLYCSFASELHNLLEKVLKFYGISTAHIESRAKSIESLKGKLQRKGKKYKPTLSEITDLAGIRIVVYSLDDIDEVEKILSKLFSIDKTNSVDKGKELKPNEFGYLSRHYIVSLNEEHEKLIEYSKYIGLNAEIQVRTILEHAWAAIDHKIKYKSNIDLPEEQKRELNSIAASIESNDKLFQKILNIYNEFCEKQ